MSTSGDIIQLDRTALMMLEHLRSIQAQEPQEPNGNMPAFTAEEYGQLHHDWQRQHQAVRLMFMVRLLSLAEEQL